jgi:hypothetical protein
VRGCSEKLTSILGNAYSIIGIWKPNEKIGAIIDYEYLKTESLTKKDVVVICGDAKDVAKNETKEGLRSILKLVRLLSNTNVIIPHYFDLQEKSCVNKEVKLFNRKLQKNMKIFDYVQICNISENREHFTTHGLHMNFKGKLWITNKWASIILSILSRLQTFLATPLPWIKETGISHRNNVNVNENDPTIEERNISKEDESKEYRILELN